MTLDTVEALVKHWVAFVKGHEKLVIAIVFALVSYHFVMRGIDAWDAHDKRQATIAQQKVDTDAATSKQADAQVAELKAQLAEVTALAEAAKAEAHAAAQKHVVIDKALPLPELESRWSVLAQVPTTEFSVTPDNKAVVSNEAAHKTVEQLESIPDLNATIVEDNKELAACTATSKQQDIDIASWKTQFTDEHGARLEDAKVAKDNEHKAWRKGFKWGAITGFLGGLFVFHKI